MASFTGVRRIFPSTRLGTDPDGKKLWPKLSPTSPYLVAAHAVITEIGPGNVKHSNLHPEVKLHLLRSRGVRGGTPTGPAMALLHGVCGKATKASITGILADMSIMSTLKLFHRIPEIPRESRAYFKTSAAGLELMEWWCESDKRFKKFFDAYTNKREVTRINAWAATLAMGFEIDLIEEREARAAIAREAIMQEEIAIQKLSGHQQMMQAQYTYNQLSQANLQKMYNQQAYHGLMMPKVKKI